MAKKALGKGLGALINKQAPATSNTDKTLGSHSSDVRKVPIDSIVPSPLQPRKHFTEGMLDDLMESIREHGIIQPLIVRRVENTLELIAGERRWRASKNLKLEELPVIIRQASDRDVLEMALIENLQREDLNAIEEAQGYVRLAKDFKLKQEAIAKRVGKSRAAVANAMRLLDLHEDVQSLVANNHLSVGHAKVILSVKDSAAQLIAADHILKKKLTVRATEKFIQNYNSPAPEATNNGKATTANSPEESALLRKIQDRLCQDFGTKVNISHHKQKGKIEIEYYGTKDLNRILDLLGISPEDY